MPYKVIAIEREYASGGSEIGQKLATKLGIPYYGKEVLERAANKMDMEVSALEHIEETMTGSLLHSLYMLPNVASGITDGLIPTHRLGLIESEVIQEMARTSCVIVGRCGVDVLKDNPHALKVFIYADYQTRLKRAVDTYQIDPKQAASVISRFDKRRSTYFKGITGKDWKSPNLYHMAIDSGKLGIDQVVDMLYHLECE